MDAPDTPRVPDPQQGPDETLMLFCPYERRLTPHVRRWMDRDPVCAVCGNHAEADFTHRDFVPVARAAIPGVDAAEPLPTPDRRAAWRDGRRPVWAPFIALAVVALTGAFTALHSWSSSPPVEGSSQTNPVVASGPNQPPAEVAGASVGAQIFVANTGGSGVYLREAPDTEVRIRAWPDGTVLKVVGADSTASGATWRHVEDPAGNQGWVPAQYTGS